MITYIWVLLKMRLILNNTRKENIHSGSRAGKTKRGNKDNELGFRFKVPSRVQLGPRLREFVAILDKYWRGLFQP